MMPRSKVFGLGLSRTGTTSLGQALNILGVRTADYPFDSTTQAELEAECSHLSILNEYDGIVDIPVAPFFAQLDRAYPDSKFILTIRDRDAWLKSMETHLHYLTDWLPRLDEQYRRFTEFIVTLVYGSMRFDSVNFLDIYDTHVASICDYFRGRPGQLL